MPANKKPWEGNLDFNPFSSLGSLKSDLDNEEKEKAEADLQERYGRVLKGKFGEVEKLMGKNKLAFESEKENIESIALLPVPNEENQLHVLFTYRNDEQKIRTETVTIINDSKGKIDVIGSARAEKKIGMNREQIITEVLDHLERVNMPFWHAIDKHIVSKGEGKDHKSGYGIEDKKEGSKDRPVDARKLQFFQDHLDRLFGFYEKDRGLSAGYHGIVFRNFAVLENPQYGNATYIVPIEPAIDEKKYKFFREDDIDGIIGMPWADVLSLSREQLMKRCEQEPDKFKRIYHRREEKFGDWQTKMNGTINDLEAEKAM